MPASSAGAASMANADSHDQNFKKLHSRLPRQALAFSAPRRRRRRTTTCASSRRGRSVWAIAAGNSTCRCSSSGATVDETPCCSRWRRSPIAGASRHAGWRTIAWTSPSCSAPIGSCRWRSSCALAPVGSLELGTERCTYTGVRPSRAQPGRDARRGLAGTATTWWHASPADLEAWAESVPDAGALDEVFE